MTSRRTRRIKILATLGPASSSPDMIEKLHMLGADVFRINMSHATHEKAKETYEAIRRVEEKTGKPIGILVDLQGPKLRIGKFKDKKIKLENGDIFSFDNKNSEGTQERVYLPHPEIFSSVKEGDNFLIDDGKLRFKILENTGDVIKAEVIVGGKLSDKKGVSLPDTLLPMGAMTDKDRTDLAYVVDNLDVDWIALSFVQRDEDIIECRRLAKGKAAIMAKIEKPSAVDDLADIIKAADGIMIARGDLGVELPLETVPALQKNMIRIARKAGKPVVVATQMLESMITSPVPTRAEVSDVATAVYEGADAVMLSAESAAGEFPCEAVAMMDRVAGEVEHGFIYEKIIHAQATPAEPTAADAISAAAHSIACTMDLAAIICYTDSGSTGIRASRERPMRPILGLTANTKTARRLTIIWGLHCVCTKPPEDLDNMVDKACRIALREKMAEPGDRVIITAGVPLGTSGTTNMLRISFVGDNGSLPG